MGYVKLSLAFFDLVFLLTLLLIPLDILLERDHITSIHRKISRTARNLWHTVSV